MTLRDTITRINSRSVAAVKLMLEHPKTQNRILVIIEGDDDKKLYKRLLNKNQVEFYLAGGCGNYVDIFHALNGEYYSRFIAIKDADFDRLEGVEPLYPNLFLTDGHDIEVMIADEAFEEVLIEEYYLDEALPIIQKTKSDIKHLSYIKWYNARNNCRLNVECLKPIRDNYDGNSEISISCCLDCLRRDSKNNNKTVMTEEDITRFEFRNATEDYNNLTNGHDLFEGISRKIFYLNSNSSKKKKKKPDGIELARLARSAFSVEKFSNTALYQSIKKWCGQYGCNILR